MVKIYFRDVSRRLLLFTLLLVGFVVHAQAITTTSNVIVFRDMPYPDNELRYGASINDVKDLITVYQLVTTESSGSPQYFDKNVDGGSSPFTGKPFTSVLGELGKITTYEPVFVGLSDPIEGAIDIKIKERSRNSLDISLTNAEYYYILRVDASGNVASFIPCSHKVFANNAETYTIGTINSVTKSADLPIYTFAATNDLATVNNLKADIASKLSTALGTSINAVDITLSSTTGSVTTAKLPGGTYSYSFSLTTPAGVKQRFTRMDDVAVNPVEPGSNATVNVEGAIVVTEKKVVTIQLPAKEVLNCYEKEALANAAAMGDKIQGLINEAIPGVDRNSISISNVKIYNSNTLYRGDLDPRNYTYTFDINITSEDLIVDFIRSNAQDDHIATISPSRVQGVANGKLVTVGNSIVVSPVLEGSVFSYANYTPISAQVQTENALTSAILTGLSNKNQTLMDADVLAFENIQILDAPSFPLGIGTYSYTFDVRAKKALKIGFSDAETTATQIILENETATFTAVSKIGVKKSVVSTNGKIVFPVRFTAVTYGTDPSASLRAAISLTDMPAEAEGYVLSLVAADGTEYDLSQTPTPDAGTYTVKLTLPESSTYDFSRVTAENGSRATGNAFTATAKLTIGQQKIGEVVLPAWLPTTALGQLDVMNVNSAKNRILNQISAIKGISSVKIYSDDNFNTEVTGGRLIPGNVYSYIVTLDPSYTDGGKTTTPVGSAIVSFDTKTNSYKIKSAISVKKTAVTIALPDRLTNPIKIGSEFASTQELTAYLVAAINAINETVFAETGLTATVSGISQLPTTDDTTIGYTVTVSNPEDAAFKSKYDYSFVTDGSVTSANLQATENVCIFNNSLLFVDVLPTTATTMRVPKYSYTYEYGWKAKDVTTRIAEDQLLKNAGILIMEKIGNKYVPNYTIALINSQGGVVGTNAAVTEGELYGYRVTINKSESLKDVDLDLPNVTVSTTTDKIIITHVNSVTLNFRSDANFISRDANVTMSGVDFAYNYTAGMTKAEIIERIKSAILFANPGLEGYIGEVTLPEVLQDADLTDSNGDFKSSYRVVLTDAIADFKTVTVNGSTTGITTEGTSCVYTGQFGLIARPILTIKLNTYKFNENDGSLTEEVIEEWIKADILKNNPDLMGVSLYAVNYNPNLKGYTAFFQSSANVRSINFNPATIKPVVMQNGNIRGRYPNSITFGPEGDIPGVPYHMNVALPSYINPALTFGKTAAEYGEDILAAIQGLIKPQSEALFPQIPTLKNWGGKISLIYNESGETADAIADDSYPLVSNKYGYKIEFANKADFEKFYTFAYTASGGKLEVDKNEFVYKLSVAIDKAKHTVRLPLVNVTYRDINTKQALQDSIKNVILEDARNAAFFADVAKLMRPARSFTVTLDAPAEGPVPAKNGYNYRVEFAQLVNDNLAIASSGVSRLNVNKAALELTFPVTSYKYGRTKVSIERDLLNKFIDSNNDLFSQYACLADNLADLFTMNLDNVNATPPAVGTYPYTITVQEAQRSAWDNFAVTYNGATVFNGYAHQHGDGVTIGLRKLTVTLPTYLAATATEGTAAKATFTFGKATVAEIEQTITEDVLALNPKLTADNIVMIALVITNREKDGQNPVIGDYSYTIQLTSSDYTFVYEIADAEITTDQETEVVTAVNAVKVSAPGIEVIFSEQKLEGVWTIVDGAPVYSLTNLTLDPSDPYGFNLISFEEDPEEPKASMTKNRWNSLFSTEKLHWALYRNNKLQTHAKTLQEVLIDYVEANVTNGTYKLRIVDASTLRAIVGNFDIKLDADLASLKVTPATVEVKAAAESYTKVYGKEVTAATDLEAALAFATVPQLNAAALQAEKNVIDLFETVYPSEANVYAADAPVGEYQLRAIEAMPKEMFTPVVGVKFVASKTATAVTVAPAPLNTAVTIELSATREYGEDVTNTDIHAAISGELAEDFQAEISRLLNAEEAVRTSWLDVTGVNKKTDVGTYELRLTASAKEQIAALLPNFNIASAKITVAGLTITKAPLTVRAKSYNRPYGAGNPALEIEYIGLKNNEYENLADVFSVMPKVATDAGADARGSYDIYFTTEGVARNYAITHENGTLSIDKIRRTIVWPEDQRNLVIPVGETVELSAYLQSEADGKASINDIRYELTGNDRERVVLSEVAQGRYAITGKIRTEGDTYVTITVYADGDDTYEEAIPVSGTIKVVAPDGDAAKVNVIVSNVTSIYDGSPRAVSVKVTDVETGESVPDFSIYYEGDQMASVPTLYPSTQDAPVDAGIYNVTVRATLGSVTYAYTAKNKMVIAPKPVVVTARSFEIKYGETLPSFANAYDYNKNDFLNGQDFLVGQAPKVRIEAYNGKAGTYRLTPYSAQEFGRNYVITFVSGQMKINKAIAVISADNKESVYGKDLEELTYSVSGLVNGETLKDLGFAPRISSTVTRTSDAGAYPITFSDNYTSDNYDVTYVNGQYVILPASQKISWNPEDVIAVEEGDVVLNASASSKLPVVFNAANDAVAYVNQIGDNWILTPVNAGSVTVTAMQHGNKNYNAAEPVTVIFLVDSEDLSVGNEKITVADQITVYPRLFTHSVTVAAPSEIKQATLFLVTGSLQKVFNKPGAVIDLSQFGSGSYLLNVTLEDGTTKTVTIIKK